MGTGEGFLAGLRQTGGMVAGAIRASLGGSLGHEKGEKKTAGLSGGEMLMTES